MPDVLFACIQNAGRSQIAKAWFNLLVEPESASAISAGSRPASHVHPEVLQAMQEVGVDLSDAEPQKLTAELASTVKILVTMGCGEECPYVPGVDVVNWQIPDPHGQSVEGVREIRDYLKGKVQELIKDKGFKLAQT
eukprot:jgi/Chrzof1/6001/Cz17g00080.t1